MNEVGGAKGFEDLAVFKLAYRLSLEVHRASLEFPGVEQYGLAEQVRAASKGICANLAEGFGKQAVSAREFRRFCGDGDRLGRRDAAVVALLS